MIQNRDVKSPVGTLSSSPTTIGAGVRTAVGTTVIAVGTGNTRVAHVTVKSIKLVSPAALAPAPVAERASGELLEGVRPRLPLSLVALGALRRHAERAAVA